MKTAIVCSLLLIFCSTAFGGFKNPVSIISPIDQYVYAGERIDYSGLDSYDPDGGSITQYTWYIDDQQVGTGSGFSQTYMLDKTETHRVISIKLKVKDNEGAIDYYSYQIAIKRKPEYHFYVKDHLGNIRVTVDEQGEIVSKDDYYPFGLRMPGRSHTSGAGNNIYKFSGKELDDENGLGLYYFGARYYDPMIGRWVAVDPLADKFLSDSPFQYTHNNAINRVDPDGKADFGTAAKLNEAGMKIVNDSNLQPRYWFSGSVTTLDDGFEMININLTTFCNFGVRDILNEGQDHSLDGMRANDMYSFLMSVPLDEPNAIEISYEQAANYAKEGITTILASFNENGSGHVAIVAPEDMIPSTEWGKMVPIVYNIGKNNGKIGANWAFDRDNQPKAFILAKDKRSYDSRKRNTDSPIGRAIYESWLRGLNSGRAFRLDSN